jgi:hypothetical protein
MNSAVGTASWSNQINRLTTKAFCFFFITSFILCRFSESPSHSWHYRVQDQCNDSTNSQQHLEQTPARLLNIHCFCHCLLTLTSGRSSHLPLLWYCLASQFVQRDFILSIQCSPAADAGSVKAPDYLLLNDKGLYNNGVSATSVCDMEENLALWRSPSSGMLRRVKVKQSHNTTWRGKGRGGKAPTYSWPRHWMGVSDQHHSPAALYPQYPVDRRLGGPHSRSEHRGCAV